MPTRTCKGTRAKTEKIELLRFVAGPNHAPFLDVAHKLPGRGASVAPTREAYQAAIKGKVFGRELQTNQPAPPWEEIVAQLEKDALGRLGLAKKAGQAHPGWEAIKSAKTLCGILIATDAGQDIRQKTELRLTQYELLELFTNAQLAAALGLPAVGAVGISAAHTWQALQKVAKARK